MIKIAEDKQREVLEKWLVEDEWRLDILKTVACLGLPQCFIAAGFIRNLIWDKLHGYECSTELEDIDVIYFDPFKVDEERDRYLENKLRQGMQAKWSVKNQARMHRRNRHRPYASTEEAMKHWVEVETAIGARWVDNQKGGAIELVAPFGLIPNFNGTITFNRFAPNERAFIDRHTQKGWCERWPELKVRWEGGNSTV